MSAPIFQAIFGEQWPSLPPVMRKHYANRGCSDDVVTVNGKMDIKMPRWLACVAPLFKSLGILVPYVGQGVPVTVHFRSEKNTNAFCFDRRFHFPDEPVCLFRSRMLQIQDHLVAEVMSYRVAWKMDYVWENERVKLKHRGYALYVFGKFVPLPVTWLVGRGHAEEWAVDDDTFAMKMTLTHWLFGRLYEYNGVFKMVGEQ